MHGYVMRDRLMYIRTYTHTVCNLSAILPHFMKQSGLEKPFQCKDNGRSKRKQMVFKLPFLFMTETIVGGLNTDDCAPVRE